MRPNLFRLLVALLVIVMLGAACGGGDDGGNGGGGDDGSGTGGETVAVDAYASDVCAALSKWVTDIQDRASTITEGIDPGDASAGKERLQQFIGDTVTGTQELIASVEAAGVPDTENGEDAAEKIVSGLNDVLTILQDAGDKIDDLPTNDPQAFGTGAQEIATSLQEATSEAASTIDSANSDELTQAFGNNPECSQYSSPGT